MADAGLHDVRAPMHCSKRFPRARMSFARSRLPTRLDAAERIVAAARAAHKALLVGYILRVHPSWTRFVEIGRTLGRPLVMCMNLNQRSSGSFWNVHKNLIALDLADRRLRRALCRRACARPRGRGRSWRCTPSARGSPTKSRRQWSITGTLHIAFDDGSVGWYEAGWGPMMSETAFFVKDMIGPKGCVSIVAKEQAGEAVRSSDHDAHTRTNALRIHHAALNADGAFVASG